MYCILLLFVSQGLETILGHAVQLMENCKPPHLLEDGKMAENLKKMACTGDVARDVFYGRCLGFQVGFCLLFVSWWAQQLLACVHLFNKDVVWLETGCCLQLVLCTVVGVFRGGELGGLLRSVLSWSVIKITFCLDAQTENGCVCMCVCFVCTLSQMVHPCIPYYQERGPCCLVSQKNTTSMLSFSTSGGEWMHILKTTTKPLAYLSLLATQCVCVSAHFASLCWINTVINPSSFFVLFSHSLSRLPNSTAHLSSHSFRSSPLAWPPTTSGIGQTRRTPFGGFCRGSLPAPTYMFLLYLQSIAYFVQAVGGTFMSLWHATHISSVPQTHYM